MPFINALPTVCPTRQMRNVKWDLPNMRNVLTKGIDYNNFLFCSTYILEQNYKICNILMRIIIYI